MRSAHCLLLIRCELSAISYELFLLIARCSSLGTHRSSLIALCTLLIALCTLLPADSYAADLKQVTIIKKFGSPHSTFPKPDTVTFVVEVVSEERDIRKGLAGRDSLENSRGMLFVLDRTKDNAFWMSGMKFSLDLIFLDTEMKVIGIMENLQPCTQCDIYRPAKPAAYALEINSGLARKRGIAIGDSMVFND